MLRIFLSCFILFWAVPVFAAPKLYIRTQILMETVPVTITVVGRPSNDAVEAAFNECRRLEKLFSRRVAGSDIAKINHKAAQRAVRLSPETFVMLQRSLEISETTGGAFDITYHSPEGSYRDIALNVANRTIRFKAGRLEIDTDGIAKGFMVDRMIDVLKARGVDSAMVNAGGDLRVLGFGANGPWKIKIQNPNRPRGDVLRTLQVSDRAVASAGFYERGPHIFDPKTHQPIGWGKLRGVSVIADDTATANALATAIWVKGPQAGRAFAKILERRGIRTILIP